MHGTFLFHPQAPPALKVKEFFGPGSAPSEWLLKSSYPPKSTEMLLLNTIALSLATFLSESVNESPQGQVSILVVAILNKFQSLTPAIISLEQNDQSSPNSPTWTKLSTLLLVGKQRSQFLATMETVLRQLLEIPSFTSPFFNSKVENAYFTLINDLRNASHILSPNSEARIVVPTDTKARRDLTRYLTPLNISELDLKLHHNLATDQEMMMCIQAAMTAEGRKALRCFGLVAAAHVRERVQGESNPPQDLLIWLALQATGRWQQVKMEWLPAYMKMGLQGQVLTAQRRFPSSQSLRNWALNHGQGTALGFIQQKLWRPQPNMEGATRAAMGLPALPTRQPGWTVLRFRAAHGMPASVNRTPQQQRNLTPISSQAFTHVELKIPSPKPHYACGQAHHRAPPPTRAPPTMSMLEPPTLAGPSKGPSLSKGSRPLNPSEVEPNPHPPPLGSLTSPPAGCSTFAHAHPQTSAPASEARPTHSQTPAAPVAHSSSIYLTVTEECPEEPLNLVVNVRASPQSNPGQSSMPTRQQPKSSHLTCHIKTPPS